VFDPLVGRCAACSSRRILDCRCNPARGSSHLRARCRVMPRPAVSAKPAMRLHLRHMMRRMLPAPAAACSVFQVPSSNRFPHYTLLLLITPNTYNTTFCSTRSPASSDHRSETLGSWDKRTRSFDEDVHAVNTEIQLTGVRAARRGLLSPASAARRTVCGTYCIHAPPPKAPMHTASPLLCT